MTKTEHYQLNQWNANDQVKRTDFNDDNAKIDAALAGLAEARPYAVGEVRPVTSTVRIELGFRPSCGFVIAYQTMGLIVGNFSRYTCEEIKSAFSVTLDDTGITLGSIPNEAIRDYPMGYIFFR